MERADCEEALADRLTKSLDSKLCLQKGGLAGEGIDGEVHIRQPQPPLLFAKGRVGGRKY